MLNPWLVTGFTDGEGCFALYVRSDRQKRKKKTTIYYRWQVDFAISLRGDDLEMLERIKEYFGCGVVSLSKKSDTSSMHSLGQAGYHTVVVADLVSKVIPHFERYPLQSKKQKDFEIWKEAVVIIKNARDRKKSLSDKVIYNVEENQKLVEALIALRNRVTGGHLTQRRVGQDLQGTKVVSDN